jgi:hypothetical protein
MGDDDIKLTADERVAFAEIEHRLGKERFARRTSLAVSRARRALAGWPLLVAGVLLLSGGLVAGLVAASAAGFLTVVVATFRLTRRWSSARCVLWWRRSGEPPPAEHMWEP